MKCSSKTHLLGKKLHSLSYTFRVAEISYIGRVIVIIVNTELPKFAWVHFSVTWL